MEELKKRLSSAPILAAPRLNEPFVIETDASKEAAGAVLLQSDVEGKLRPVAYASRRMNIHERRTLDSSDDAEPIITHVNKLKPYFDDGVPPLRPIPTAAIN
uniref:RT_RNaseH_2 domain-containing protein n=1 Tax=Panagrellus redivivus TaxID=6233 RepID=A0A7E4W5I0_PANRE